MKHTPKHRGAPSRGRYILFGAVAVALLGAGVAWADPFGGPDPTPTGAPLSLPASSPTPNVTPSPSPSSTPAPKTESITLTGVGDVIMGTLPSSMPPDNGAGYYDDVKAKLASDLVMGNLEEALSVDTGNVKCGAQRHRLLRVPPADELRRGAQERRLRPGQPGQQPLDGHGAGRTGQHPRRADQAPGSSGPARPA